MATAQSFKSQMQLKTVKKTTSESGQILKAMAALADTHCVQHFSGEVNTIEFIFRSFACRRSDSQSNQRFHIRLCYRADRVKL